MVDEQPPADSPEDDNAEIHLVEGSGLAHAWRRLAWYLRLPVIAWGGRKLYRISVRGGEFWLPFEGGRPAIGFYTTRYVAARNPEEAEAEARRLVWKEWQGFGGPGAKTLDPAAPVLWMEGTYELADRCMRGTGGGFTFYSSED